MHHVDVAEWQLAAQFSLWKTPYGPMGRLDSSKTRVAPVFDRLFDCDPTGAVWLDRLIRLGTRASEVDLPSPIGELVPGHLQTWGEEERSLSPPLGLLEWLIENVTTDAVAKSVASEESRRKRLALAHRDPDVVQEALTRLRAGERGKRWFVLEGESCPDAYIETDSIILVVEGKRTERSTTSKTTFMQKRSQLIRHTDAAREVAGGRRVLGLLLVEGESPDPILVPKRWSSASDEQLRPEFLVCSLPHRTAEERDIIAGGILGVATWQRVCQEFSIEWPPVEDPG